MKAGQRVEHRVTGAVGTVLKVLPGRLVRVERLVYDDRDRLVPRIEAWELDDTKEAS